MSTRSRSKNRIFLELLALTVITAVSIFVVFTFLYEQNIVDETAEPEKVSIPEMAYGIIVDSLVVIEDEVKRNEFLADILLGYNVDYNLIDEIARNPKDVFDVRKIRVGYPYSVILTRDSVPQAQYFVYEESSTDYIVFDLRDTLSMYRGEKEVVVKAATASGTITSSLWNTMVEIETDPNLANELSEIYAWTIDFFGIQKGDHFRVIYEELYVEDEYIGLGQVIASGFNHMGHEYYAFYFAPDSTGDFYDDEGGSMRRTFLKAPLRYRRISSGFSYSRMHPVLKYRRPHLGVDYAAPTGTPVQSIGDGVVVFAAYTKQGGYTIRVKHNGTYTTAYAHLSGYAKGIKQGVHVKQGQLIGYVGSTGLSTGPHLDFRFYRNGKATDPLQVKAPPAKPVDTAYADLYQHYADSLTSRLDSIAVTP